MTHAAARTGGANPAEPSGLRRWRTAVAVLVLFFVLMPVGRGHGDLLGGLDNPYPLRPADTSSPRDTLRSFTREFNAAVEGWRTYRPQSAVRSSLERASETLDLSELPTLRQEAARVVEMALLKEILDRVELPPYDQIPGDAEVAETALTRWQIPNTKIEIVQVQEGPRAGQFLFSRETVAGLGTFYELVRSLPYREGATVGLYNELRAAPGPWVPKEVADQLPAWTTQIVFGQGLWQWLALALLILGAVLVFLMLYRWGAAWDRRHEGRRATRRFGVPLVLLGTVVAAEFVYVFALRGIGLLEVPLDIVAYGVLVVQVGGLAWFTLTVAGRLADGLAEGENKSETKRRADAALLRIVFRLLSIVILVYLGIYAVEAVGIPIAPLIAGLGVGGLAIALAVRPTLENIIGGLTLFADRPVRVGDFCKFGDQIGTVEQIGLRSTRIRSLERTLVTVPNSEFAQMQLDNFQARDMRLLHTILQLRYETTPEQLRYALAELRKMLLGHPMVTPEPARVRFVGYGAYSLDLEVFAYLRCQDHDVFLAIQEDVLLRMADIIKAAGTGFAFPSQTTYHRKDDGVDEDRARVAEEVVEDWRQNDRLPFPDFDPGLRWEMENILDYPPKGSYDYKHRKGLGGAPEPDQESSPEAERGETSARSSKSSKSGGASRSGWRFARSDRKR